MPTYDYVCKECGHRFEAFQSMKDAILTTCPECNTEALQRLIGAGAGLVFKGSGFYLTDYKKTGSTPAGNGDKSAKPLNGSEAASASTRTRTSTRTSTSTSTSTSTD